MRLYIEGHNHKRGYAISREWAPEEIRAAVAANDASDLLPVRYVRSRRHAIRLVERFNRRFGDKP